MMDVHCKPYNCKLTEDACATRWKRAQNPRGSYHVAHCRDCDEGMGRAGGEAPDVPSYKLLAAYHDGKNKMVMLECSCGHVAHHRESNWRKDRYHCCAKCAMKRPKGPRLVAPRRV